MKCLIIFSLLIVSSLSFAESARMSINPFEGELITNPKGIKITSVSVRTVLQHCNLTNTTCAGGPQTERVEMISFNKNSAANLIKISSQNQIQLSSNKPFNKFSSCKVSVTLKGLNELGKMMEGYIQLIHENDKSICQSSKAINEQITNILKVPQIINFWNI